MVFFILELSLPTESTYAIEETTRGITVLGKFDSDQPPTIQNQPPNADILDKVIQNTRFSHFGKAFTLEKKGFSCSVFT
jgi:hypothetical protein